MTGQPTEQPTLGFIGLGIMGRPMAQNLRKAGFPFAHSGFDRARTVADWRFIYVPMVAGEPTRVPSPLRAPSSPGPSQSSSSGLVR
jgi:hypothetical protein